MLGIFSTYLRPLTTRLSQTIWPIQPNPLNRLKRLNQLNPLKTANRIVLEDITSALNTHGPTLGREAAPATDDARPPRLSTPRSFGLRVSLHCPIRRGCS